MYVVVLDLSRGTTRSSRTVGRSTYTVDLLLHVHDMYHWYYGSSI